jgi:hypothetical protein
MTVLWALSDVYANSFAGTNHKDRMTRINTGCETAAAVASFHFRKEFPQSYPLNCSPVARWVLSVSKGGTSYQRR